MDKNQLLQEVRTLAQAGQLSRGELLDAFEDAPQNVEDATLHRHVSVSDILYYVGGAIVFLGIVILVGQNWESLNTVSKILVTLGSAIAAYLVGVFFNGRESLHQVATAFFFISALLMPLGIVITLDQSGLDTDSNLFQTIAAALSLAVYAVSYYAFRKNIFHIFNVIFGTWLFYAFTNYIAGQNPYFDASNYFLYRTLGVGASFVLLGYYFAQTGRRALSGPLYSFGLIAFLGSAMALQGYVPDQSAFWEIIYPGLVFGVMFLSVKLRSSSFLTFGALFLMGYILKITGEYFSEGLGWPTSLVIAGLALIAVGYYTVQIKKKYIG